MPTECARNICKLQFSFVVYIFFTAFSIEKKYSGKMISVHSLKVFSIAHIKNNYKQNS